MKKRILLTSFDICLKYQQSNSSDDLLLEVTKLDLIPDDLSFLRQLPVDVQLANNQVMEKNNAIQPEDIICYEQAAILTPLSVEAFSSVEKLEVDIEKLVAKEASIQISHDCFYYLGLDYLDQNQLTIRCLFTHVSVLNQENLMEILQISY
ncbi:MAG: peptidase C15 [Nostoc sp.]|uniref:peptidase C15 n=1 Tax=Nostoc sp. TaxID=1180 RepID=UPI002FFD4CB2